MRPSLLQAMIDIEKVVPYFDLSFQHSSGTVLRAMRRFGDSAKFLHLISQIRALSPQAGIRSNVIVGFPGETEDDYQELRDFVSRAGLDAIGVFGYSDEDNTEALHHENKVDQDVIRHRVDELSTLVDESVTERASSRIGEDVVILIEDAELQEGRAAHQGPEVDGTTSFVGTHYSAGEYVEARIVDALGADLIAEPA
jgi:ribosomal protein S12 methylthiotransferase